eukprot:TRINITY_DN23_c0_g1_i1.p1 TRINITY_DN23_c0_g1~~TRINITY_DN23_c0_g1_i1.p1  ORF type:complete len:119 (-),score=21.74 TRINITY_DN23_c0_g1_i1:275-631(-)
MVFLEPDPFLTELTKLYERNRQSGTVWVTLKRSTLKKTKKPKSGDGQEGASVPEASDYRCLVRASDGKRKISASLSPKDHQRFQMAYATVLRAHMDALKKREKKEKKDKKSAAKVGAV